MGLLDGSGVNQEVHAPFCERPGVKFPRPTCHRCHYVIDWNYDEDRCRIRTGYGPENVSRLRRFAVGAIQFISDRKSSIAEKMRQLHRNTRLVFDYLRMTKNEFVLPRIILETNRLTDQTGHSQTFPV